MTKPKTEKTSKLVYDPKTDKFFRLDGSAFDRMSLAEMQQAFIDSGSERRVVRIADGTVASLS